MCVVVSWTWLPMQSFPRGHHQRSFVLDALQSGTYFYRLTTADGLVRSHTVQVVDCVEGVGVFGAAVPICQTNVLPQRPARAVSAAEDRVELVGWFPNPTVTDEAIAEFADRYAVEWEMARDTVGWSEVVERAVYAEAALVSPDGEVVYRGRVNDLYYALGKHRSTPRSSDLALAVDKLWWPASGARGD